MRICTLAIAAVTLTIACGSASEAEDTQSGSTPPVSGSTGTPTGAVNNACDAPLVRLQTSFESTCDGGNEHWWPVGLDPEACHGWGGTDGAAAEHQNSAKDIRCNPDGTFQFTQYAGNLTCQGNGVTKVYALDVCEQDIPPTLYTVATDLACCLDPQSPECTTGTPSVSVPGGVVYLDGEPCD